MKYIPLIAVFFCLFVASCSPSWGEEPANEFAIYLINDAGVVEVPCWNEEKVIRTEGAIISNDDVEKVEFSTEKDFPSGPKVFAAVTFSGRKLNERLEGKTIEGGVSLALIKDGKVIANTEMVGELRTNQVIFQTLLAPDDLNGGKWGRAKE